MKKYFTSIEIQNSQFVATVYDGNSNQELYKTKPYNSQAKAMQDANSYLTNYKPVQTPTPVQEPFTNTAIYKPTVSAGPRRCCGR